MDTKEAEVLDQIREAMRGCDWRLEARLTFSHGIAVQVFENRGVSRAKWVKVGPLLFPSDGGTVADTLRMLGDLSTEAAKESPAPNPADDRASVVAS